MSAHSVGWSAPMNSSPLPQGNGSFPMNPTAFAHGNTSTPFVIHHDTDAVGGGANAAHFSSVSQLQPHLPDLLLTSNYTATLNDSPTPLTTAKLGNLQQPLAKRSMSGLKQMVDRDLTELEDATENASIDSILTKLSDQRSTHEKHMGQLTTLESNGSSHEQEESIPGSAILTPATDTFATTLKTDTDDGEKTVKLSSDEVFRLQKELDAANDKIARQEQELSRTRVIKHTVEHFKGAPGEQSTRGFPDPFHSSSRLQDDTTSEFSDVLSTNGFNRGQNIWNTALGLTFNQQTSQQPTGWNSGSYRPWMNRSVAQAVSPLIMSGQQQQSYSGPSSPSPNRNRFPQNYNQFQVGPGFRRPNAHNRVSPAYGPARNNGWENFGVTAGGPPVGAIGTSTAGHSNGMFPGTTAYQPRPIGTPLSATAAEFNVGNMPGNPWNPVPSSSPGQIYLSSIEPLNYRRLLDRNVTCDWTPIVQKIVCNNDQQASIFLQQKLKSGTMEQKYSIVDAIVAQAFPLMVNRFGNFLVQRCFEHGTPDQVIAIANAIRGNTLTLSMDAFGCHVVQKAFDIVPEDFKATMVHELLRRIPETVIHRYACHVWQKLFELRWNGSPPQIMDHVNTALKGMWHEVALGETGSLVVQNIFENCLEEDKRPCITEVLASIDIVAHGQFGNWCIQHICEHGAVGDRTRAIDHVLQYATEYSMDQYASKVVEKGLKIGGVEFLERYLQRVCEGRPDRPRIPLIDIASDQYGNYLIQYILTHANTQHREVVASHIRKHMVSLRGSKFGSRVGMLCCNPAYATRPGPTTGHPIGRSNGSSHMHSRFGGFR